MPAQPGILAPLPPNARHLTFRWAGSDAKSALQTLAGVKVGEDVLGLGHDLLEAAGAAIPGMRPFPTFPDSMVPLPSTPAPLWIWIRDADRGDLAHRTRAWIAALRPDFELDTVVEAFVHHDNRDLGGHIDGTENPTGADAEHHALVDGDPGMTGSSFAAVQLWRHDFDALDAMTQLRRDHTIGRRQSDNVELDDAPASAHVKRTAQEDFTPEAFVLRRSMPWSGATGAGLQFVAFGRSLDAFDAQLRRMSGAEDGVVDALFDFSTPETGATFWCPPLLQGGLDLRAANH